MVMENLDRCYDCNTNGDFSYKHYSTLSLTSALDVLGGQRQASVASTPGKSRYSLPTQPE
jgi:hypothetical protein